MTGIKQVAVLLDGGARDGAKLALAAGVARRFGAGIEAIFARRPPFFPYAIEGVATPQIVELQRGLERERGERARQALAAAAAGLGQPPLWTEAEGDPLAVAFPHAQLADLVVVGQPSPDDTDAAGDYDLPADLVMAIGRPLLVVPYAGQFATAGNRILVAWNGRREAARALADALPFLAMAEAVTAVWVNPGAEERAGFEQGLAAWFARHGIKGKPESLPAEEIGVGDALLSRAADLGADLMVMGAYGRARLRELILGGATRDLLGQMTLPTLMSH